MATFLGFWAITFVLFLLIGITEFIKAEGDFKEATIQCFIDAAICFANFLILNFILNL